MMGELRGERSPRSCECRLTSAWQRLAVGLSPLTPDPSPARGEGRQTR
jgi:hypothetical protein